MNLISVKLLVSHKKSNENIGVGVNRLTSKAIEGLDKCLPLRLNTEEQNSAYKHKTT